MIIVLGSLVFISLYSTFSGTFSCSKFGILVKLMVNIMNKVLYINRLSALYQKLVLKYYKEPKTLDKGILFAEALLLLFYIPIYNNYMVDLHMDILISLGLDIIVDSMHKVTHIFNIITNIFNLFFSSTIDHIPNKLKRKIIISL